MSSLIADGQYRNTSLGRDTWKSLIGSEASLQYNCNKEGFNAVSSGIRGSKARIGIISNDRYNCTSCDSRIDLALVESLIIATHVETRLHIIQIMGISILREWDTFWCSDRKLIWANLLLAPNESYLKGPVVYNLREKWVGGGGGG